MRKARRVSKLHPLERMMVKRSIVEQLNKLHTAAGLHAFMGEDASQILQTVGRTIFITAWAVGAARISGSCVDFLTDAACALGELAEAPDTLEELRPAIYAGATAAMNLMPMLSADDLAEASLTLQTKLNSPEGLKVSDVISALGF